MQIILFSSIFSVQSDIQTIAKIGKMSSGEEGWHTDDTQVNHQMLKWFCAITIQHQTQKSSSAGEIKTT